MTFQNEEEKPSIDDALVHFGVLGMKWGHKRQKAGPTQIRAARRNVDAQARAYRANVQKVKKLQAGSAKRSAGEKALAKQKVAYLKNPDRVIAVRLTRGEKLASVIIAGPLLGTGFLPIIGTSVASRRIERKQDKGRYDRPNF